LDLKGGSELVLQVDYGDYTKERLSSVIDSLRDEFRRRQIKVVPRLAVDTTSDGEENYVSFSTKNPVYVKTIRDIVRQMNADLTLTNSGNDYKISFDSNALNRVKYRLLEQSMEIVRKRIDETGTREPIIQSQGRDRILVQVPGMENSDELKNILGKTAKMTFHFVDMNVSDESVPANVEKMYDMGGRYYYYVDKQAVLSGDSLSDAIATFSEGKPVVSFRLNAEGTKKFADLTKNNIGKILAIVLDDEVVTAPKINSAILGGNGIISGSFSVDEANRVALLLRAGALPTSLKVVQERIVGPSLGQDSIKSGLFACGVGFAFVLLFMVCLYKKFGIIADITLIINLMLTVTVLSLLNATLTLPGMAGLVLSIGMAVDVNVLIFERIREEYAASSEVYNSVKGGFDFAWTTILDSNLTTLIVAIILYVLGTGAIRGFALVLGIGIFISMFSGVLLTKLLLSLWLERFQPKTIVL